MGDRETVQTEADEGISTARTNVGDQAEQKENKDKDAEKDVEKDKEGRKRKAMEPRSDVWDGYHKILVGGLLKKAKCKYYQYLCDRLSACANVDLLLICCIPVMSAPWKLPPETAAECNCVV